MEDYKLSQHNAENDYREQIPRESELMCSAKPRKTFCLRGSITKEGRILVRGWKYIKIIWRLWIPMNGFPLMLETETFFSKENKLETLQTNDIRHYGKQSEAQS